MKNITKDDIMVLIKEIRRIIKLNKHITASPELQYAFIELPKMIKNNKCSLYYAYTDLLAQFEEFIDNYNIDVSQVTESIRKKFKENHESLSDISSRAEDSDGEKKVMKTTIK